jgi:antitoxin (DNA-binding transcriptional repressor) of toxin-antitoxin stability system
VILPGVAEVDTLFSVEEAQDRFEDLIERALRGEEILIGDSDRAAKLIPARPAGPKHGVLEDALTAPAPASLKPVTDKDDRNR